jgi:hypothetical protein
MSNYVQKFIRPVAGESYFAATCPTTGKVVLIDRDESRGMRPFQPELILILCHHCQSNHQFDGAQVSSLVSSGEE